MILRYLFSTLCVWLIGISVALGQENTLAIPDVTVAKGKSISLPMNLNNTADVVAVQFTLTVPEGITIDPASAVLSERSDGHTVTLRSIGANRYMAMVYSSTNAAIKARTGKLLSVSLTATTAVDEGAEYPLTLSDVVIGARDGSNLATGFSAGKVAIAKSPDLEVGHLTADRALVQPGDKVQVGWTVTNIGGLPTTGGWAARLFLKNEAGDTKLLGTFYQEAALQVGDAVAENEEITIPTIVGMDGDCRIMVKITPSSDSGEPSWLLDNNTAETDATIAVQKALLLTADRQTMDEADANGLRLQISRSGSIARDESFTLTHNADSRITLPSTVTIREGQSSSYFYARPTANHAIDSDTIFTLTLAGNGYPEVSTDIVIEDDTYPSLALSAASEDVTEGGSLRLTVSLPQTVQRDVQVALSCDYPTRFTIPTDIVIPAGQTGVEVTVNAVEDEVPHAEEVVTFTAKADRFNADTLLTVLVDNDIPTLRMEITPAAVSEAAGPVALVAKLWRTSNKDKKVTVKFSDDSEGGIYYGRQTIVMDKGVEEVTVNLGPIDNAFVDGDRTVHITAAVWIASCSCSISSSAAGGSVTQPVIITDNDGPTLTMTSSASIVNEGSEITFTLKRNTDTASPLTVTLSGSDDTAIDYPREVTIPAGSESTTFVVRSMANETTGDGRTITLRAEAGGYSAAHTWFMVSDQTLPDAQIVTFSAGADSYVHGDNMTFSATVANKGNYDLPANTPVSLYRAGTDDAITTAYLTAPVAVGATAVVSLTSKAAAPVGSQTFYVKVNARKDVEELDYNNNASASATLTVLSPFATTTSVSKSIVAPKETVEISGTVSGSNTANASLDVYVINRGYRHVIQTQTDEDGRFTVAYTPYDNQYGHFVVGACFPGDMTEVEQCAFDIYGLDVKNSALTCDVLKGESYTGSFTLTNNGTLPLTNVRPALLTDQTNAQITFAETSVNLAGGQSLTLGYTVTGLVTSPVLDWQVVRASFTSDEGAVASSDIRFYIREPMAELTSSVGNINTTVTIGEQRDYLLTLTNTGKHETGPITFSMPAWLQISGPQTLNSLSTGESTEVTIAIKTDSQMSANVPVTGNIGINCEFGNGISIPFRIEPVSSQTGILSIDVCDEFTYYTDEAPHVAGAKVEVKHPTTGRLIVSGTTDEQGIFSVELPAGYYAVSVTAEKHDSYNNNIYVDPERTRNVVVNLGYSAVSYTWNVEETEVEDQYTIVTKVTYETNVPVPCVVLDLPDKIDGDNMRAGESTLIYITATNKGLITALNTRIVLPEDTDEWRFEALTSLDPFDLPAQQSVVIPVRITRLIDGTEARGNQKTVIDDLSQNFNNCMAHLEALYDALCGTELKTNKSAYRMALKFCAVTATLTTIYDYISQFVPAGPGLPIGGGGSIVTGGGSSPVVSEKSFDLCDPCDAEKAEEMLEVLIGFTWFAPINDGLNVAIEMADKNESEQKVIIKREALDALVDMLEEVGKAIMDSKFKGASEIYDLSAQILDIKSLAEISASQCPKEPSDNPTLAMPRSTPTRSWQQEYNEAALIAADYLGSFHAMLQEIFGDVTWFSTDTDDKWAFALAVADNKDLTLDEVLAMRPASVTDEQALKLFKRLNGLDDANAISNAALRAITDKCVSYDEEAVSMGYASAFDRFRQAHELGMQKFSEMKGNVCASIKLQFSQQMVMTRQAFRGTLTVFNGNETTAMSDVKLALTVKDEAGHTATSHEFQINPETLTGFAGKLDLADGWTLDANATGVATILFIPTKYAAPTEAKVYSFGGSLSYVDPFTGLQVTRDLAPVALSVKPSPNLELTYFMQRDVIGDDPLTPEVEPCEEAEFSLLINNTGYGDATNVRMFTEQPKIVDNEKGLLIDFELMSSQLNGGPKDLALGGTVGTDFGLIPAKTTAYAQWWLKSSLLGHFTDYDIEATHVTSYGNPDLSLLDKVTIHELIRSLSVEAEGATLVGFMTNDTPDANDTPDMLYLSDGQVKPVALSSAVELQKLSDTQYLLTAEAAQPGWHYGSTADPTYGTASLVSVVRRSDGKTMPLRNFWLTDRTLRDGEEPLYENRIHFADDIVTASGETYLLTFEPMPALQLSVASIEGVPQEGSLTAAPVDVVKVMFNKYIDPSTFTVDDISLAVQGVKQDLSAVTITTDNNKTFTLDFSALNATIEGGYFVLTVQTANVKDTQGFYGKLAKQATWNMFRNGQVALRVAVEPEEAGSVQLLSQPEAATSSAAAAASTYYADYGAGQQWAATSHTGYTFSHWTVNGETVTSEPTLETVALANLDIVAHYTLKKYAVEVQDGGEAGSVAGASSGLYSYGEELRMEAQPAADFEFAGWTVNGQPYSADPTLTIVVDDAKTVSALFKRVVFQQSLTLARGWNWISSYMAEPVPVDRILGNVTQVLGQFDELIKDPVYGMTGDIDAVLPGRAYKVNATYAGIKSFSGRLHDTSARPIHLLTGWNWIAYPHIEEQALSDVIANPSEGDCLTSQLGFAEYADGTWEGTLTTLSPGIGYIYKSVADKALDFSFAPNRAMQPAVRLRNAEALSGKYEVDPHKYPSTMNIIATLATEGYNVDAADCCIYAFAGSECRGESRFVGDSHYLTVYGDEPVTITFVVENLLNGDLYMGRESLTFTPEVIGSRHAPYLITFATTTGIDRTDAASRKLEIYTVDGLLVNPEATPDTLRKLSRGVYIVNGQKLMVK